jgi:DNA-binding NtrC family response regulator
LASGGFSVVLAMEVATSWRQAKGLPPLRDRLEDIADLAQHFFALAAAEGLPLKRIDTDAIERLKQHSWPGNVRELQNLICRLAALYPQETITSELVELELGAEAGVIPPDSSAAINSQDMRISQPGRRQADAFAALTRLNRPLENLASRSCRTA